MLFVQNFGKFNRGCRANRAEQFTKLNTKDATPRHATAAGAMIIIFIKSTPGPEEVWYLPNRKASVTVCKYSRRFVRASWNFRSSGYHPRII